MVRLSACEGCVSLVLCTAVRFATREVPADIEHACDIAAHHARLALGMLTDASGHAEPAWASFGSGDAGHRGKPSSAPFPAEEASGAGPSQQPGQSAPRGAVPMQSAAQHGAAAPAPDAHQSSPPIDIPVSHGLHSPPAEAPELDEFSSFNYWRSPPAMLVDDADLARDSADADSPGAHSAESPTMSPEAANHVL